MPGQRPRPSRHPVASGGSVRARVGRDRSWTDRSVLLFAWKAIGGCSKTKWELLARAQREGPFPEERGESTDDIDGSRRCESPSPEAGSPRRLSWASGAQDDAPRRQGVSSFRSHSKAACGPASVLVVSAVRQDGGPRTVPSVLASSERPAIPDGLRCLSALPVNRRVGRRCPHGRLSAGRASGLSPRCQRRWPGTCARRCRETTSPARGLGPEARL